MRWLIVGLLMLLILDIRAQDASFQCQKITKSATVTSTQLIVFETITVSNVNIDYAVVPISTTQFKVELQADLTDSLEVCFSVLPAVFSKVYKIDSARYYDSTALFTAQKKGTPMGYADKRQELFDMGELNRSGQISRGFATGNTQNLSVNSSLNLNLEGKLSEDLSIRASITDQDIPFQPEGNTQQLQDFDKVFIQLYNDKFSVTGGDVVLENGDTRFLKYRKNVLGGKIDYFGKKSTTSVGASAAKGQFASERIDVQEGIYGPYKIPPPDGLGFVIIIANSEKVYLDGKQLIRGYDNDYIIDYNQAEIEFTSNVLLTRYSRIRVDYEYAVRSYARSIITASHTQQVGKANLGIEYYQEKDNKNKSLFRPLSQNDKQVVSNAGDSLQQAVVPGEKLTEYNPDKLLYIKKDTLIGGQTQSIFVFTTAEFNELFAVQFTEVGAGKGDYRILEYLAQGRVYEWVGAGQGGYIPYILLTAPNKKQMVSINGNVKLGANGRIYFESAFSQLDKNLFSELDAQDNNGQAFTIGGSITKKPIGNSKYTFSTNFETEYLSKNFTIIDRFRRVEFDRDWGIATRGNNLGKEDINVKAGVGIEKDALNFLNYNAGYRSKQNTVQGFQHQLALAKSLGFLQVNANAFLMDGTLPTSIAQWRKLNAEAYIKGKIQPGYRYILQQNTTVDAQTDSVISSRNYFDEHQFFVRANLSTTTQFEVLYSKRLDKLPQNGELMEATDAETVTAKLKTKLGANHTINLVLNYRDLGNKLQTQSNIESISGRLDWIGDIIPKSIRNELSYNIANSRVPKREYVFIEVPTGEGTHAWRDDNGDGIKDLDEFYEAFNYDEKRFIKLYVPSNKFVDAFENRFNYRLSLAFPRNWGKEKGVKKLMSRFSSTTSWTTQYSTTEDNLAARLIPFLTNIDTSKLLSSRESFRSTFFINKNNPTFGINIGYLARSRKVLYTNGFEGRKDVEYTAAIRWNVKRKYQLEFKGLLADRLSNSDYLKGRNYQIVDTRMGPSMAWQPKPALRLTTSFNYGLSEQLNLSENGSYSLLSEISSDLRIGTASKFVFNALVKYTTIEFKGDEQTPVGYELLKGLRPGNNYSLVLSWQQRLANGLQIQLFYEGRKPENVDIIHSMRAGVSALF